MNLIHFFHIFNRALNKSFQHAKINIRQALDVQAGARADLMLAQLLQKALIIAKTGHNINRNIFLSGSKTSQRPVSFLTASLQLVVVKAKTNNALSPHCGLFFYRLFKNLKELLAVLPPVGVLYPC